MKFLRLLDSLKSCTSEEIEEARTEFANMVIYCAAASRNNGTLLDRLNDRLPANFLTLIGEGSTRRCYSSPLGVCVKIQREDVTSDPLQDHDLEKRGGIEYLPILAKRRRTSNFSEIVYATKYPRLAPKQYGFIGGFGVRQTNPSVLIAEMVQTLDRVFPGDTSGIALTDMGVDSRGDLHIFDDRITLEKRPLHLTPFEEIENTDEQGIWLGNIGLTEDGRYVFSDRSNLNLYLWALDPDTLNPRTWKQGSTQTSTQIEQTLIFSQAVFMLYQDHWEQACREGGSIMGKDRKTKPNK